MRSLEQLVRHRVEERLQIDERRRRRKKRASHHRYYAMRLDRIVAIAIINGVFRDLGVAKSMDQEQRQRSLARFERVQRRQRERDHHMAVGIINGVMARLGMPWPEIEAKAARGWRGGGGLRRRMERY